MVFLFIKFAILKLMCIFVELKITKLFYYEKFKTKVLDFHGETS